MNSPNRQLRRRLGKTDFADAEADARAAHNGEATARPKTASGPVEAIRMLRVVRRSAVNQLHALVVTAPESVKDQLKAMNLGARVKICARFRPGTDHTTTAYAKRALRHLTRRYQTLTAEIADLDTEIRRLCAETNPALLAASGIGPDTAALLVAAGDNPDRMNSEAASAAPCTLSPVQASSGTNRSAPHQQSRPWDVKGSHRDPADRLHRGDRPARRSHPAHNRPRDPRLAWWATQRRRSPPRPSTVAIP